MALDKFIISLSFDCPVDNKKYIYFKVYIVNI